MSRCTLGPCSEWTPSASETAVCSHLESLLYLLAPVPLLPPPPKAEEEIEIFFPEVKREVAVEKTEGQSRRMKGETNRVEDCMGTAPRRKGCAGNSTENGESEKRE